MGETAYMTALNELGKAVDDLHELMHDPFKAPELTIEALPHVQAKMWDAQVEYAAMRRAG